MCADKRGRAISSRSALLTCALRANGWLTDLRVGRRLLGSRVSSRSARPVPRRPRQARTPPAARGLAERPGGGSADRCPRRAGAEEPGERFGVRSGRSGPRRERELQRGRVQSSRVCRRLVALSPNRQQLRLSAGLECSPRPLVGVVCFATPLGDAASGARRRQTRDWRFAEGATPCEPTPAFGLAPYYPSAIVAAPILREVATRPESSAPAVTVARRWEGAASTPARGRGEFSLRGNRKPMQDIAPISRNGCKCVRHGR